MPPASALLLWLAHAKRLAAQAAAKAAAKGGGGAVPEGGVGTQAVKVEWQRLIGAESARMGWGHREAPDTLAAALRLTLRVSARTSGSGGKKAASATSGAASSGGALPSWPLVEGTVGRLVGEAETKERGKEQRGHNYGDQSTAFVEGLCRAQAMGGMLGGLVAGLRHREVDARFASPVAFVEPMRGKQGGAAR
jgi:hypothetical protein